jgi:hypothetical protein
MSRGVVVLESHESKRLIGKAVAQLPAVKEAYKSGRLIIAGGTTNAYVAEELTGQAINKASYTAGVITDGRLCCTAASQRIAPLIFEAGQASNRSMAQVLADFTPEDCFIKGANALDLDGIIGILASHPQGGTIGAAGSTVTARGSHFIAPVGLEKLIPSVPEAAKLTGQLSWERAWGAPVSLYPVLGATVITECEAFQILSGVQATMIASGGTGGSEGSVVLALEGELALAWRLVEELKREKPIPSLRQSCQECQHKKCGARNR